MKNIKPLNRRVLGFCLVAVALGTVSSWTVRAGDGSCQKVFVSSGCSAVACSCVSGNCTKEIAPHDFTTAGPSGCDCVCVVAAVIDCGSECLCYEDGVEGPTTCSGVGNCLIDGNTICGHVTTSGFVVSPGSCGQGQCDSCDDPC